MYRIEVDEAAHRVIIEFSGGYADDEFDAFDAELHRAVARAKGSSACFDMIVDWARSEIMPQETSKDSERRVAWCLANGLRRSANITGSALMKMQLQRVAPDPRFRSFAARSEGLAWLDAG